MGRLTPDELLRFRGATVPDLVSGRPRLVFVGINPGLWTAAVQTHFARPGNRFYPALHRAGLTAHQIDPTDGFAPEDRRHLTARGIAITNLVGRATARADELTAGELRAGAAALVAKLERWRPRVVCFVGITAYRTAFRRPRARKGRQPETIGGAEVWALGNPSGLNAHETVDSLARAYREVAQRAGILLLCEGPS